MASLIAIAIFLPLVVICYGAGARVLRCLRLPSSRPAEEIVVALPVGMGVLAYLVLALGLLGWLTLWPALILLLALAAVSIKEIGRLLLAVGDRLRRPAAALPAGAWAVVVFLLVMAGLTLLGALAPAGQNDWDALSYHLAAPKIYLEQARIIYLPWMPHSNFPFTPEMLYTLGLLLDGQRLAKLFDWFAGVLVLVAAARLAVLARPGRTGLVAATVLAATPIVAWEATTAGNDLALALYTVVALLALARWARTESRGWLWASGIACGFALGTKPTAAVVLLFLCAAVVWQALRRGQPVLRALGAAVALGLIACAVGSPWYIKSAVWTHNPVYPFLYGLFDGRYWSAEAARLYRAEQLSFGMGHGPAAFLLSPWNLTVHPQRFFNFPEKALVYVSLGPLYLALVPLLALAGRPNGVTRFLLAFAVVFWAGWFLLSQHIRYVIPVLPALAVLAAAGGAERRLRLAVGAACCIAGVAAAGIAKLVVAPGAPAAMGVQLDAAYLMRTVPYDYPVWRYINTALPRDAKIVTLGETRGFYLERDYLWGDPGQHTLFAYDRYRNADELVDAYAERGITHVLMGLGFVRGLEDRSGRLAQLFIQAIQSGRMQLLYEDRGRALFALRPRE